MSSPNIAQISSCPYWSIDFSKKFGSVVVRTEVRMFNSLSRYGGEAGSVQRLEFPAGAAIDDILENLQIPKEKIFLILVNGKDITPKVLPKMGNARTTYVLEDGDVVALSGSVPYSWGYGTPIV